MVLTYKVVYQYGASASIRIGCAFRETKMTTSSPLISSPLRTEIVPETYQDEELRLQILQMRQLLNSDSDEQALSNISWSQDVEAEPDGTAAVAQAAILIHPREVKLVEVHTDSPLTRRNSCQPVCGTVG